MRRVVAIMNNVTSNAYVVIAIGKRGNGIERVGIGFEGGFEQIVDKVVHNTAYPRPQTNSWPN